MTINKPQIREDMKPILEWARQMREKHFETANIIELLVDRKDRENDILVNERKEARKIYNRYNAYHRSNILFAIQLDGYRLENDIKEGQIVTNGSLIGYVGNISDVSRTFELFSSKDGGFNHLIGSYLMDDFKEFKKS